MGLDRLVIKSIVDAAKSSNKLNQALDSLKDKAVTNISENVEKNIPIELPFNIKDALEGGPLPKPTEEELSKYEEIPEEEKQQIRDTLDTIEASLNNIITTKNSLQGSINQIQGPLDKVEDVTTSLAVIVNGLKISIAVIKNIPIPTSVPPGVGIPVNVITRFSNSLDTLSKVVDKTQGPITAAAVVIPIINNLLDALNVKLSALDPLFQKVIDFIATIRALLEYGPDATQDEIDDESAKVASGIQESLAVTGNNSSGGINALSDEALLERLKWVTDNPYYYRGFRLILERDPDNTFGFPARRISAKNNNLNVRLFNTEDGQYSFSNSVQVLVNETLFLIDQYIRDNIIGQNDPDPTPEIPNVPLVPIPPAPPPTFEPFGSPGTVAGEVRFRGGQAWRWLAGSLKWTEYTPTFDPIGRKGDFDGEEETILKQAFPLLKETWEWSEILYKWNLKSVTQL